MVCVHRLYCGVWIMYGVCPYTAVVKGDAKIAT